VNIDRHMMRPSCTIACAFISNGTNARNLAMPKVCWHLETPLVEAIFDGRESGILHGHREIRPFFEEGARRRPNALVRGHRTGKWLTDGERLLVWEYPRQAPDGDQVDIVEVMEIADTLIQCHRIYWGWFGTQLLTRSAVDKARKAATV
jgi:steroid Delta-isomerase